MKTMKQIITVIIFGLFLSQSTVAQDTVEEYFDYSVSKIKNSEGKGHIIIKFHGGTLCWLPGSACEGSIEIVWGKASDDNDTPVGFSTLVIKGHEFKDGVVEARVFHKNETSDGSMIFIPKQKVKYSKKSGLTVLYAKLLK